MTMTSAPVASPRRPATGSPAPLPWLAGVAAGLAVLLAGAPVSAIVQGVSWFGDALAAVGLVVGLGLLLYRAGPVPAILGQAAGLLLLLTAQFGQGGLFGVLPGPAVFASFGQLVSGAGDQIAVGIAPVAATPEILFLVTAAFGVVTIAVHLAAVTVGAPAAAGVPLLAVFAVPAALSDELLPWWTVVSACAGFGLLLVTRDGARGRLSGVAVVAGAVVLALGVGAVSGFVGTAGRFTGTGAGTGAGGAIGLSPFTSLRGQLSENAPTELFRVRGLPRPAYMRALTLRDYVPDAGWQATRPDPGPGLPGTIGPDAGPPIANVAVENVGFRDYWLPLFASPVGITGVGGGQYVYDQAAGTAYTARPRQQASWQETTALATPSAAQLRAASGPASPGAAYLDTRGVDGRVTALARQLTAGATTSFDRAMALQEFFTGPGGGFTYNLKTAPGNGDDALVEFLTVGRQGYCEQFSAAMAVMLRTVGVPARVAVGFTGGVERDGYRSISTSDAHAWVEAWFPGYGWITFDPTPLTDGRAITPPYVAEALAQAAGAATGADGSNPADENPRAAPSKAPQPSAAPTPDQAPAAASDTGSGLPLWPFVVLAGLVVAACTALVPAGLRARARRQRLAEVSGGGAGAAGAGWNELLAESTDRGVPIPDSETVRAAARRLVRNHGLDGAGQDDLRAIVGAVEASFYGDKHPAAGELDEHVRRVRSAIAAGSPLSWRQRLLPRSVTVTMQERKKRAAREDGDADVENPADETIPARSGAGSAPPYGR